MQAGRDAVGRAGGDYKRIVRARGREGDDSGDDAPEKPVCIRGSLRKHPVLARERVILAHKPLVLRGERGDVAKAVEK